MTTTENATTWRDLIAELTPPQITEMGNYERHQFPDCADTTLTVARFNVRQNRARAACAHIPAPRDAIDTPSSWLLWDDDDVCQRGYTIWEAHEDGIVVQVLGLQFSDDRPTIRSISYEDTADHEDMTAERARTLGRLLIEASDILGDGGEPPWPVDSATRPCCGVIGGHAPDCEDEPPFT